MSASGKETGVDWLLKPECQVQMGNTGFRLYSGQHLKGDRMTSSTSAAREAYVPRLTEQLCAYAVIAAFCILLLLWALDARYNHDEEQYVFAGLLTVKHRLYSDFVYLQTPYYPLLLAAVFSFVEQGFFLLARIVAWMLSTGTIVLIFLLGRRLTERLWVAVALSLLFGLSTVMLPALGSARNDIMPCFFALLGVYLVVEARSRGRWVALLHGLGGVALGGCGRCQNLLCVRACDSGDVLYCLSAALSGAFDPQRFVSSDARWIDRVASTAVLRSHRMGYGQIPGGRVSPDGYA